MKANELTIGQKYIWRRNSEVTHEVVFVGIDNNGQQPLYEFEYKRDGDSIYQSLSVHHVDSDIIQIFEYLEKYYPNYYNSGEIACLNDLAAFMDNEITYEV